MDAVVGVAADEAEVVVGQPEHGGVVDHAAGLVAHRRVDDLPDRQLADVAGDRGLHERLGVGADDLPLAQRREVHDHGLLAAGPVLGDRPLVVVAVGQPVAAVVDEVARELRGPGVKRGLLGHLRVGLRGDAMGDRHREAVLGRVDADMDVGDLPAVGRVDVVRARRGGAHEVAGRPQQHVVPGPRPRLVHHELVVGIKAGVVEEVQRLPALAPRDPERGDLAVEVLAAVHVARVAHVLVVLRRAGQREAVVPADRVLHDLHERIHVHVEALAIQPRLRIGRAHQRPRRRRVQAALDPVLQLARVERQEVRALAPLDVDDLDVLARLDLIGERRRPVDADVEAWLGQRRRELRRRPRERLGAVDLDGDRRGRPAAVDDAAAGRGHDHRRGPVGSELGPLARRGLPTEQVDGAGVVRPQAARVQGGEEAVVGAGGHEGVQHRGRAVGGGAERREVLLAALGERREFGPLAAVRIDDRQPVARPHGDDGGRAGTDPPRLERRVDRPQAGLQQARARGGDGHQPPPPRVVTRGVRAPIRSLPARMPRPCRPGPGAVPRAPACRRRRAS